MAGGLWSITNRPAATAAASASQAAPTNAAATGMTLRLRSLQATLAGTAVGTALVVVRDGATGAGAIIWQGDLSIPANGSAIIELSDLDLRATSGNALTVETTSGGGASTQLAVSAAGDMVPVGYPAFQA